MNYVISVIHRVDDLHGPQSILTQILEFAQQERGADYILLSNGALNLKLILEPNNTGHPLYLDVSSTDLDAASRFYCQHDFIVLKEATWVHEYRQEIHLQGPHNIHLIVFQHFDEDQLGILPDLKTSLHWHDDALEISKRLIKTVPIAFRGSARQKIIETAESDAIVKGLVEVELTLAIQTVIRVTPDFQHHRLKDELSSNGLVPEEYFPDD